MNKKLIFVLLILIIAALVYARNQRTPEPALVPSPLPSPTPKASVEQVIAKAFSQKYGRPADAFIIEVTTDTGTFAKGSVGFQNELGGGLWFGAKTPAGWELASDGQGPMSCEIAEKYNFPKDMVPGCIDIENGNAFVER